jgi:hypothetical protein
MARLVQRLLEADLCEAVALTQLRGRQHPGLGCKRVREPELRRHTRRNPDGPVDSRRNQAVDTLRFSKALDPELVLGRDDRPSVGMAKPGCARVAIDRDHVQAALPRSREQPELGRPRP